MSLRKKTTHFSLLLLTLVLSNQLIGQTLDQDYITGIPTTTSFGGHPLGTDNDQGQSFTAGATGDLWGIEVVVDLSDPFMTCGNCLGVGLIMEITNGNGFGGTVLGTSDVIDVSIGQNALTFNFSSSIPLLSGNSYTWEVKRVSESCSDLSVGLEAEFNGSYNGGVAYNNGAPASSGQDILFRTFIGNYVPPAPDPAVCTLDQDYISGIPTTTSFGGHPLGADNDQGQSFTSSISGNLQAIEVVLNIYGCSSDNVTLLIELHNGDGFLGSVLGTTSSKKFGVIADSTVAFFFSTPLPVTLGSIYTFELKRIAESVNGDLSVSLEAEFNGSYNVGVAYNNGAPASSGQDILFRNYNCCVVGNGTDIITACNSYTWIDGNTYNASNKSATFNIVGGSANGCDSIVTLDLTVNNVTNITTSVSGRTIIASNGNATYQWLDCDNNYSIIPLEINQGYSPATNGNYAVELTQNSCVDTTACVAITTVGIVENSFGEKFTIYPNPTDGNFSLDLGDVYEKTDILITDLSGKLIASKTITQSQTLNLSLEEPPGIYIVSVQAGEKKAVIRLIKE
ncbi:MAG: hypothetical protein ACI8UQ_000745 [Bacteroidia bacterium]|jgi:hypothetical protein